MNTRFEPTYDDHIMEEVYNHVPNWSQITLYSEFEITTFEKIINDTFIFRTDINKHDYFTSKKTKDLIYFYKNITKIGQDIVICYNVANKLESEPEDDEKINLDDISINENLCSDIIIYYNFKTKDKVDSLLGVLQGNIHQSEDKNTFYTIGVDSYGFKLMEHESVVNNTELVLHYGKDFLPIHEEILNNLKTKFHGLFLFHGDPGTGKCVTGDTFVTLRDKTTGEIIEVNILDFYNSLPVPEKP